jgi:uncharacterized membrane protein
MSVSYRSLLRLLIILISNVLSSSFITPRTLTTYSVPPRRPSLITRSSVLQLHGDPSYTLTAVLLLSTFGITLERHTVIGKALSAPLTTMALALTVANLGLIPFESPIYTVVNRYLVPLAVPMLLFDSDMKRVVRDTGSLLAAFAVGAFATVVATIGTFMVFPMTSLGPDAWKVACALNARHIGGAINFVAVAETLQVSSSAISAAIAADNVCVALYFLLLFSLAKAENENEAPVSVGETEEQVKVTGELEFSESTDSSEISLPTIANAICTASVLVSIGRLLTKALVPPGTSILPLTSALTVLAATVFSGLFKRVRKAGSALGIFSIQMFFAASGASGSIALVLKQAPSLFCFSALQIAIHFSILMTVGRFMSLPSRELYLASNACVGGPTTAAAMAQAKNWKQLVLPGLLVGILGYATATVISLALGPLLVRLPQLGR